MRSHLNSVISVLIRLDASSEIGLGHAKRCLALVQGLQSFGVKVSVCYQSMPDSLIDAYESIGVNCVSLGLKIWSEELDARATQQLLTTFDETPLLIVDHYQLSLSWEQFLRPFTKGIIVIDDWGNRAHDCDILIDQNLCENPDERYKNLLPNHCIRLIGLDYVLLSKEVLSLKETRQPSNKALVSFGGAYHPEAKKVIQAIIECETNWEWQIILGMISDKEYEAIRNLAPKNIEVYRYVDNMHDFLANAGLCIGASGSSNWERFYLGIPSIVCPISNDQTPIAQFLKKQGIASVVPDPLSSTIQDYQEQIDEMDYNKINSYKEKMTSMIDGQGIKRVCQTILTL